MNEIKKEEFLSIYKSELSLIGKLNSGGEKALTFYKQNAFPTTKTEAWRDTDLNELFTEKLSDAPFFDLDKSFFESFEMPKTEMLRLVFVNGHFSETLSDTKEACDSLIISDLNSAIRSNESEVNQYFGKTNINLKNNFTALNTAFAKNGSFILVKKNKEVKKLIHLIYLTDGRKSSAFSQVRNLIVLGENSKASILESYVSLSSSRIVSNFVSEVFMKQGSNLEFYRYQVENENDFLITNTHIEQEANSHLQQFIFSMSGKLIRNDVLVNINGEGSTNQTNGLSLADKTQHFDNSIQLIHAKPNCNSKQLFKSLIDNEATCVFNGKVLVAEDAQKTNAMQSNKNILLTETATARSKPQLEIYADDVACSHGSTTGQIDTEALFYMQARGLGKQQARALLLFAFAAEVAATIKNEAVKEWIENLIDKRLRGRNITRECKHVFFK